MWFVFPQLRGLGHSPMAEFYGMGSLDEARAYLAHETLGQRLRECAALVLACEAPRIADILEPPDDRKLRSSMTLFQLADPTEPAFAEVLTRFFGGVPDSRTLAMLESIHQSD